MLCVIQYHESNSDVIQLGYLIHLIKNITLQNNITSNLYEQTKLLKDKQRVKVNMLRSKSTAPVDLDAKMAPHLKSCIKQQEFVDI